MNRCLPLVAIFALAACGVPTRAGVAPTVGANSSVTALLSPDASPSEVYVTLSQHRSRLQAELKVAFDRLESLRAQVGESELRQGENAIYESTDPDGLRPFLSRANLQEQDALPADERRRIFVMNLSPAFTPARVEIRDEAVTGDRATLEVRGYFEEVFSGEPGWSAGIVTLTRDEDGWRVDSEAFHGPGTGEDDAPSGGLEVGALPTIDEPAVVTHPIHEGFGGGWGFAVRDKGYVVQFNNLPYHPHAGEYTLTLRPSIPGDADPTTIRFPVSVSFSSSGAGGASRTWDEAVTGTLTITSVAGGLASGRFVFTADPFIGEPVTVRGSFQNIRIPE